MEPSFVGPNPTAPANFQVMVKLIKSSIKSALKGVRNDPEVRKVIYRFPRFFKFVKKRLTPDEKFGLYLTVGVIFTSLFVYFFFDFI